jgi:pyruvate-ferredoxin/flavodoxin oxidoreductase
MKGKIAQRWYYDQVEPALAEAFEEFYRKTGRRYDFVMPYRCDDAEYILVGMGCYMETAQTTIDWLRAEKGIKAGCVNVYCFRPFPATYLVDALKHAKAVTVIERMDDPLSTTGNHLTREIKAAFCDAVTGQGGQEQIERVPKIYHGAAGLGSRDVRPGDIYAIFENMIIDGQDYFTVGIKHATALDVKEDADLRPAGAFSMRGHSVGGFGSVTTNKVIATIGGQVFGKDVQAYPKYGSEKKGLPTTYYLTIAREPIRQHAELQQVEFVPIHAASAFRHGAPLAGLADGGTLFMQTALTDPEEIWGSVPAEARTEMLARRIRLAALDTAGLAREHAPRPDLEVRMQGVALVGVFLRLAPFAAEAGLDRDALLDAVRGRLDRFFGKRGAAVVEANLAVIAAAYDRVIDVTAGLAIHPSTTAVAQLPPAETVPLLEEAIP